MFNRTVGAISAGIGYLTERRGRKGGDGVIANKEETESEELQAGDSKENRRRQG